MTTETVYPYCSHGRISEHCETCRFLEAKNKGLPVAEVGTPDVNPKAFANKVTEEPRQRVNPVADRPATSTGRLASSTTKRNK